MTSTPLEHRRKQIGVSTSSAWLEVDQSMIDGFADATLDHQFIHIDPERAAQTPFGGTVAHGFLTLSLLTHLAESIPGLVLPDATMNVNYGFDRIRFVQAVRSGSRIRAVMTLLEIEEKRPGQFQQKWDVVVEIEGGDKPALTAVWIVQSFI